MSAHVQQAGLSGRSMTLVAVIGLHAVVISALIAIRIVPDIVVRPPDIDVIPITPVNQPEFVPPAPKVIPVKFATPFVPPLVVPISEPIETQARIETVVSEGSTVPDVPGATNGSAGTAASPLISTELQYQIVRPTDDYYPDASVRLEERGVAIVQVCVDAKGRIAGQPAIQTSSGHTRLDRAAVRWASESLRFTPATLDGVAVAACKGFRVNFSLR